MKLSGRTGGGTVVLRKVTLCHSDDKPALLITTASTSSSSQVSTDQFTGVSLIIIYLTVFTFAEKETVTES